MDVLKQFIRSSNWDLMRSIRLIIGVLFIIGAFVAKDAYLLLPGLYFAILAYFNAGCCTYGSCSTGGPKQSITHLNKEN